MMCLYALVQDVVQDDVAKVLDGGMEVLGSDVSVGSQDMRCHEVS